MLWKQRLHWGWNQWCNLNKLNLELKALTLSPQWVVNSIRHSNLSLTRFMLTSNLIKTLSWTWLTLNSSRNEITQKISTRESRQSRECTRTGRYHLSTLQSLTCTSWLTVSFMRTTQTLKHPWSVILYTRRILFYSRTLLDRLLNRRYVMEFRLDSKGKWVNLRWCFVTISHLFLKKATFDLKAATRM